MARPGQWFEVSNSRTSVIVWAVLPALYVAALAALHSISRLVYMGLAREDFVVEHATASLYCFAGFALVSATVRRQGAKAALTSHVLTVLLGAFFLFVAGEEISWGQRLLGFHTPESLAKANYQGEANLHNLAWFGAIRLDQHRVLNLFVAATGIVLPLVYYFHERSRRMLNAIHFPIIPVSCCAVFALAMVFEKLMFRTDANFAHEEHKEFLFSAGYFLFSLSLLARKNALA